MVKLIRVTQKTFYTTTQEGGGMNPYKCPVCFGTGRTYDHNQYATAINIITCHACGGSGIVWDGIREEYPDTKSGGKTVCGKCGEVKP